MNRMSDDEFIDRLKVVNPEVEPMEKYINSKTKISCRCKNCNNIWKVSPNHLLNSKSGCPVCKSKQSAIKRRKDPDIYKQQLADINPTIELLEEYIKAQEKIRCRCKLCGHEWSVRAIDLLLGVGCPGCIISKGELVIMNYLYEHDIEFFYDIPYFDDLYGEGGFRLLRPDFILPEYNIWIEFDGRQHFEPVNFKNNKDKDKADDNLKKIKNNDMIKNLYAIEHGWWIIRISYHEYDYIEDILDECLLKEGNDGDEYIR